MRVFAIDPGNELSAWVLYDGHTILAHAKEGNDGLLSDLRHLPHIYRETWPDVVVIEQIESFGMAVGREVFETVFWSGRFAQASAVRFERLPRRAVKLHLCHSMRAKDANIRQALLDRFGGAAAKGTKYARGPLYGIRADEWSALALAVTWYDTHATLHATTLDKAV